MRSELTWNLTLGGSFLSTLSLLIGIYCSAISLGVPFGKPFSSAYSYLGIEEKNQYFFLVGGGEGGINIWLNLIPSLYMGVRSWFGVGWQRVGGGIVLRDPLSAREIVLEGSVRGHDGQRYKCLSISSAGGVLVLQV